MRPTIFSNVDGLAVFNTSGEDARYLEQELGETINRHDVLALAEHECYLRLPNGRDGSAVLCSVQLDPPPPADAKVQREVAEASAANYGREAKAVDTDLLEGLNRIERTHNTPGEQAEQAKKERTGMPTDGAGESAANAGAAAPGSQPGQPQPAGDTPAGPTAGATAPPIPAAVEPSSGGRKKPPQPRTVHRNRKETAEESQQTFLRKNGRFRAPAKRGSGSASGNAPERKP